MMSPVFELVDVVEGVGVGGGTGGGVGFGLGFGFGAGGRIGVVWFVIVNRRSPPVPGPAAAKPAMVKSALAAGYHAFAFGSAFGMSLLGSGHGLLLMSTGGPMM